MKHHVRFDVILCCLGLVDGAGQANARWDRSEMVSGLGGAGHVRVRSQQDPRPGVLDRHSPADGERVAARRARFLLHPHRLHGALQADARLRGLLSDGLGRQRPANRAPRAELLRRSLRSVAAVRPRFRAAREAGREEPVTDQSPQLRRAVRAPDRRGREGVRGTVASDGPKRRLDTDLPDHRPQRSAHKPAGLPAQSCSR